MGVYSTDSAVKPHVVEKWIDGMLEKRGPEVAARVSRLCASDPHLPLPDALRRYIHETGTVNHAAEMQAEVQEIGREVWYRGVHKQRPLTDEERGQACQEWWEANAGSWRQHLLRVYDLTIARNSGYFDRRLRQIEPSLNVRISMAN